MSRRGCGIGIVAIVAAGTLALLGTATPLPTRTAGVHFGGDGVRIDLSVEDFARNAVRARLESGLRAVLELRVYAYRARGGAPLAVAVRACEVSHDLWRRTYDVRVRSRDEEEAMVTADLDEVIASCLVARRLLVADAAQLEPSRGEAIHFAVAALLNPRTPATTDRVRRWLERPGGAADDEDSFFGSFTSLFVERRIADAEAHFELRSQTVTVPP